MYFGNSVAAIFAGMMAEAAADAKALTATATPPWHYGGFTAPFDLSALFLVLGLGLISVFWTENYGEESRSSRGKSSVFGSLGPAVRPADPPPPPAPLHSTPHTRAHAH